MLAKAFIGGQFPRVEVVRNMLLADTGPTCELGSRDLLRFGRVVFLLDFVHMWTRFALAFMGFNVSGDQQTQSPAALLEVLPKLAGVVVNSHVLNLLCPYAGKS
jgi:hypothetical protein